MIASKGFCEAWQRVTTLEWIKNLAMSSTDESIVVFEGQIGIAFIKGTSVFKSATRSFTEILHRTSFAPP